MPEADFMAALEAHAFMLCVEGGGLDPSPKAWSALLHGAIPIIRDSPLVPAYARLPDVVVADWHEGALCPAKLARWHAALRPWFDDPDARREVLHRLSGDYWWRLIAAARPLEGSGALARLPVPSGGIVEARA